MKIPFVKTGGKPRTRLASSVKQELLRDYIGFVEGKEVTEAQAMSVPAYALSVGLISELIAQLPLRLMKRTDVDVQVVTDHLFYDVWQMPAGDSRPTFTGASLVKWALQKALVYGNAYIEVRRVDGGRTLRRLIPIDPRRVTVKVTTSGEVVYEIGPPQDYTTQSDLTVRTLPARDIIHIRGRFLDAEGICGVSTLSILKSTLNICIEQNRHARDSLSGGNINRYITIEDTDPQSEGLDEETIRAIKSEFNSAQTDNTVPVLDSSVKVNTDKYTNTEAQFDESRRNQVLEISRVMGVPPPLINSMSGITAWGSGLSNILSMFIKGTLLPIADNFERAIGAHLLTREERRGGYYFDLDMAALYRGEAKDRALIYRQLVDGGIMSVAEARQREGLPHVEGTDGLLPPKNNPPITEPEPKSAPGDDMPSPEDTPTED